MIHETADEADDETIGDLHLDEVVVENIEGSGGVAMFADELSGRLAGLWGCLLCGLQAEGSHELVKLGALDLDLLKVSGVATDGDLCA